MTSRRPDGQAATAEELLEALITDEEYRAVLRYAREHQMEKDDAVFFLVAMLKTFAFVFRRLVELVQMIIDRGNTVKDEIETAEQRFQRTLGSQIMILQKIMNDGTRLIGHHTPQMNVAAGEMKVLREQLELTTRDAGRTLAAYEALKDVPDQTSLTTMFERRMTTALEQRIPSYDQAFRGLLLDTIHGAIGRYFVVLQCEIIGFAGFAIVVVHLLRR